MNPDLAVSPYGIASLWAQSDGVIKTVAVLLLLMSIASWTVIAWRAWCLGRLRGAARDADAVWHASDPGPRLRALPGEARQSPFGLLAAEAQASVEHHIQGKAGIGLPEWLTERLRGAIDEGAEHLQAGLPLLASVGSTAPFVGLFGTVWGIYHALIGIGATGQASIDRVAGPVGEALVMTACGLAVAIPAVLAYNALNRANKRVLNKLNRFARQLHAYHLIGVPVLRGNAREA
ncbi:MAG: MotA/TolQ/ExbB proton channel family protein [Pseudomonas sp.]